MSRTIGLNSFNLFEDPKYILVSDEDFSFDMLYVSDRTIREAVSTYPTAPWGYIEQALSGAGFVLRTESVGNVFWHTRHWNEHLMPSAKSFFVTFPDGAPYELAGEVLVATSYPGLYTIVPDDYFGGDKMLLLNANHEPIFPSDVAWVDENESKKIPLGPVQIIRAQFSSDTEAEEAQEALRNSGYGLHPFRLTTHNV